MAKRPTLSDITSLTNSSNINVINQNWDAIQEAFDNTVSRDGSIPNTMAGDLDLNGNALLNVGTIDANNLTLDGQQITDISSVPEWRSAWLTGTGYIKNDLVKTNGNVYICLVSHTSGTFSTDLTMVKWELMVSKGDSGGGTGDLLSANNLSDISNPSTARANLGLGTLATQNTVPVDQGGTGATDALTARVNLDLELGVDVQAYNTRLNTLATVADPNTDKPVFWDDSAGDYALLALGNGLQISGTTMSAGYTWAAPVTATGAGSFDFTSIPTGVSEIIVVLNSASLTTKSDVPTIRIGTGGTPATSGYDSVGGTIDGTSADRNSSTTAFITYSSADYVNMVARITKGPSSNIWVLDGIGKRQGTYDALVFATGQITLGGVLDVVRVTRTGSSNYNGGTISVGWR